MTARITVIGALPLSLWAATAHAAPSTLTSALFSVAVSHVAYQVLWTQDAALLDDGSGAGPIWAPVSLRLVMAAD
jgi:hypothetical protein